jgi:hypothetical protein
MSHLPLNHGLEQAPEFCCIYTIDAQRLFIRKPMWYLFTMGAAQVCPAEYIGMLFEIATRNLEQDRFHLYSNRGQDYDQ